MTIKLATLILAAAGIAGMVALAGEQKQETTAMTDRVVRTEAEWKKLLTPDQYRVLRQKGTEPAFCGALFNHKEKGTYVCAGCGQPLFSSGEKFDSGTGWPSYFQPIDQNSVKMQTDRSHFMVRTEVLCSRCGGHLGHVFEDGPPPTGLRYCINSVSLNFVPAAER